MTITERHEQPETNNDLKSAIENGSISLRDDAGNDSKALIVAIRNGDSEAFAHFYLGYGDSLIRFLTKLLRNEEDAREITQDTFALLWEKREALDPHTSLRGFVSGIARNLGLHLIRERSKGIEADDLHYIRPEFEEFADSQMITNETEILLKSVIRNMPPQRRKIYEMSRTQGLTYNEIARQLGISYNTVKFHIQAALSDIRSALTSLLVLLLIG